MKNDLKSPPLRILGFNSEWKRVNWFDTVDISTEMVNPKSGNYDNLPHIGPGNIESFTGKILDNVKSVKDEKLISSKFLFRPGDVIYSKIRPQLAKYALPNFQGLASADAYVLKTRNGLKPEFLYMLLHSSDFYKYSTSVSMRTGMPKINREELNQYSFYMPFEEEQVGINEFFKKFNDIISLHHQELEALKQTKQGFLQKMFPSEGQLVPEMRFKEFNRAWTYCKLNEISEKVKEKNVENLYSETFTNSAEFGIINQRDFFDKDISNKLNLNTYYVVQPDDFVYNPRISNLAPVGPINRNKLGRIGVMSPLYYVFRIRNIDPTYLESYFFTNKWHMFMRLNGDSGARSDRLSIKDSIFSEMPVPLPSIEEQIKIGEFFRQLDEVIELKEKELDALKETKKGFLQKMFV